MALGESVEGSCTVGHGDTVCAFSSEGPHGAADPGGAGLVVLMFTPGLSLR